MKGIRSAIVIFIIVFQVLIICDVSGNDADFKGWGRFSNSGDAKKLLSWARCLMDEILDGSQCRTRPDIALPPYYGQYGLFVTLMKNNRVRGCFGAFSHRSHDFEATLRDYLAGALKRDTRYRPIERSEAADTRIIITVAGEQYSVDDIYAIDTSRYGVVITTDNSERIIFVPSEIKNIDFLKRRLSGQEIQQIAVFRAITIREDR